MSTRITHLLDTNILSDLIRNPRGIIARHIRETGEEKIATSLIVAAELRYGCLKKGSTKLTDQVNAILDALTVLPHRLPPVPRLLSPDPILLPPEQLLKKTRPGSSAVDLHPPLPTPDGFDRLAAGRAVADLSPAASALGEREGNRFSPLDLALVAPSA